MKTKVAVAFVLKRHQLTKYALAKAMGASPPSVDQWLKKTRMSKANAEVFYKLYKVQIVDAI
jgi:predicted transcriptional regulator